VFLRFCLLAESLGNRQHGVCRLRDYWPAFFQLRFYAAFMTPNTSTWKDKFRASLPTKEGLAVHPWLKPVAERMMDAKLWRLQHESVARGVAVGTFWAFVIPFAQIVVAAAHCVWWRANIPVAAAMTMVTNPLTVGFWLWLAYQLGTLGMGLFAVGGALAGYVGVKLIWRLRVALKRRMRRANHQY
jgi:uncharacterized protein